MNSMAIRGETWMRPAREAEAERPTVSSEDLLQGAKIITIDHEGTFYTLRLTRQNKLLLTK
ncbi:MAG: hemin uptake protein HemP [Pseudomonadota bacterium]